MRPNGETWTYQFTVTGGTGTNRVTNSPAVSGGGEARQGEEPSGDLAGHNASARRRLDGPAGADRGAAAATIDIAVERAYTKTATDGDGTEVAAPEVGQTVYFYVDYSVTGATGIVIISRRAVFDGEDFCHTTETTGAGSYFAFCSTGWMATAGDHTLRWDFDYNNQATETDETNNSATAMWTSSAAATDLVASRAFLKTMSGGMGDEVPSPTVGQTVFFYVDLTVMGPPGGVMVDRRALIDGQSFCSFTSTLEPGEYFSWCTDGWAATAGSHTLRWDLDYNNTVEETDENNNSATVMFTAAAAGTVDLEARRAYLNTMPGAAGDEVTAPAVGQAVYFHLDFSVIGSGGAVAVERRAVFDDETFCSFTGSPSPGDYLTWCSDSWTATAGTHTLRWDLDFNNTVPETNEANNTASTTFTSGGGACTGDCNGDHDVTVNELVIMVNVALGTSATSLCSAGDANGDGDITVNEIIAGVNRALSGCG